MAFRGRKSVPGLSQAKAKLEAAKALFQDKLTDGTVVTSLHMLFSNVQTIIITVKVSTV